MRDELKRTWTRETRLDRQKQGFDDADAADRRQVRGGGLMRTIPQPTRYGRIFPPDAAWLGRRPAEPALEPDLPIVDAHHHLWQRPDQTYLLPEFLADLGTGHTVTASVFIQCHAMHRAAGPEPMRPVGETEFVAGIAAMSDSGGYGPTRIAAGIVGYADLALGEAVEPVLQAHLRAGGGRFRGVRHSAAWDADPVIGNGHPAPGLLARPEFRAGLRRLTALGSALTSGSSTPNWPRRWIWCGPAPTRASSSAIAAGRWAMAPMPASATTSSRSGGRG